MSSISTCCRNNSEASVVIISLCFYDISIKQRFSIMNWRGVFPQFLIPHNGNLSYWTRLHIVPAATCLSPTSSCNVVLFKPSLSASSLPHASIVLYNIYAFSLTDRVRKCILRYLTILKRCDIYMGLNLSIWTALRCQRLQEGITATDLAALRKPTQTALSNASYYGGSLEG